MKSIEITATEGIQSIPESDPRYSQIMKILEPKKMKVGDSYYSTCMNGSQGENEFADDSLDRKTIEFGNDWSTPEQERRMAAILQAHLQLAHIVEEIGESKEGEERYAVALPNAFDDFVLKNVGNLQRRIASEFSTYEKCNLFIERGRKWLEILHPLIKK